MDDSEAAKWWRESIDDMIFKSIFLHHEKIVTISDNEESLDDNDSCGFDFMKELRRL